MVKCSTCGFKLLEIASETVDIVQELKNRYSYKYGYIHTTIVRCPKCGRILLPYRVRRIKIYAKGSKRKFLKTTVQKLKKLKMIKRRKLVDDIILE